jgi:hypothetical protein
MPPATRLDDQQEPALTVLLVDGWERDASADRAPAEYSIRSMAGAGGTYADTPAFMELWRECRTHSIAADRRPRAAAGLTYARP